MKRFAAIVALLSIANLTVADIFLIHIGGDMYKRIRTLEELPGGATQVIRVPDGGTDPGPGPPPTNGIVAQVTTISNNRITTEREQTALLAVLDVFQSPQIDESRIKFGMDQAIANLALNVTLFPGNQFVQWWTEVAALTTTHNRAFMRQVHQGTKAAAPVAIHPISVDVAKEATEIVNTEAAGESGEMDRPQRCASAAKDVAQENNLSPAEVARLNLAEIIEIVRMIIQLLRDLGIFGGGNLVAVNTKDQWDLLREIGSGPYGFNARYLGGR